MSDDYNQQNSSDDFSQNGATDDTAATVPDVTEIASRISTTLGNLEKAKTTVIDSEKAELAAVEATKKSKDSYKQAVTDALAEGFITKDLLARYGHKVPSRGNGKSRGNSVNV